MILNGVYVMSCFVIGFLLFFLRDCENKIVLINLIYIYE